MDKETENRRKNQINKVPDITNSGNANILIAFIEIFFTKFIDLVLALDKVSLTTKLIILLLSLVLGWTISIIAFFYIVIKAIKG